MKQPNVVFILTDDQGYGDLSCLGNPVIKTPAIDSLYTESVRFTDFHVAPVCTPTRGELMTGCDALNNGATYVCMGRSLLRSDLPTMADIFSASGYTTGHFGKWHLGDNYPFRPQDRGFDETIYHPAWGITSAPDYFGNDYFDDHYRHKDEIEQFQGYCTDVWFNEAIAWMKRCHSNNDRFFAYVATNAPHGPLWVPDQYRTPYLNDVERDIASFYGMIANIDENMARLESFLQNSGLRENTILIFMTDNGTATGQGIYNAGMRGKKASLYDGGHRVPFFVRWPDGGLTGGRDVEGLSRGTDVLPTLIDLCGLSVPDGWHCDGISHAASLRGAASGAPGGAASGAPPTDRMAVVQYGHVNEGIWGYSEEFTSSILWGSWRLVNGNELYDVAVDPGQQHNVFEAHPEMTARLKDYYLQWWDRNRDSLARYQRVGIGSPAENPSRLCSSDWAWVYADNPESIRGCVMDSGTWHVDVCNDGLYSFELRRWPAESGLGVSEGAPVLQGFDGTLPAGKALPVSSASIRAAGTELICGVQPSADSVKFEIPLDAGPAEIQTWWYDADQKPLAGAYYLTAAKK